MFMEDKAATWQPYFAWFPVYIGNRLSHDGRTGKLGTVWLEWVERRRPDAFEGEHVWSRWVYRMPGQKIAGSGGEEWSR